MLTSLLGFALARRGFTVTVALLIAVAGVVAFRHLKLRSEEHTSELQSLTNLVCRLLLEKKNHLGALQHCLHGGNPAGRVGQSAAGPDRSGPALWIHGHQAVSPYHPSASPAPHRTRGRNS